uniref:Uncharacterized protein n=1 Tax=Anguilla anguilla TaxID=7936 RepID=A0A0E9VM95_ANGAN
MKFLFGLHSTIVSLHERRQILKYHKLKT